MDVIESGRCLTTLISGSLVYAAYEATLDVIDISDPSNPTRLGYTLLPGVCWDIDLKGNYLYCQCSLGQVVQIVDIANPTEPTCVGSVPGDGYALDVDDDRLYVQFGDGFRIYDISAPASPVLLGSISTGIGLEIIVQGDYLYTAVFSKGLRIFDVSDPAAPAVVTTLPTGFGAQGIDIAGSYAYLVNFLNPGLGLYVVDISNPEVPTAVGFYTAPYYIDVSVANGYAHVVNNYSVLDVFDVSDPSIPMKVGSSQLCVFDPWTITVSGDLAAVCGGDAAMNLMNLASPQAPSQIACYEGLSAVNSVDISSPYLAVGLNSNSFLMMNRYDTSERHFSSAGRFPAAVTEVVVKDNYAYVGTCDTFYGIGDGFSIVEISDPANVVKVAFLAFESCVLDIEVGESHAYHCTWNDLVSIDLANPNAPVVVGALTPGPGAALALVEPYLYVAGTSSGLRVVDVSNPASLTYAGPAFPLGGDAQGIAVSNAYAYITVTGESGGLRVVDISTPQQPSLVANFGVPGYGRMVAVREPYAYFELDGFLRVLDVSTPSNPVEVAHIETGRIGGITFAPPYIFAIQYVDGAVSGPLLKLQTDFISNIVESGPVGLRLGQNYPNPFNPSTTIDVHLPSRSYALVEVFDVRGRPVRKLADETMSAGPHSITWDGKDERGQIMPSGVYFYRLTAGGRSQMKKMVILK